MAVRAAVLHHRALAWADLMKSTVLTYSMCLALLTLLLTAFTKLMGTKCLEVSAGIAGQLSFEHIGGILALGMCAIRCKAVPSQD